MSQLIIADLNFFENASLEQDVLKGGENIVPNGIISTDLDTALDVKNITGLSVSGNIVDGFKINLLAARGAAASAAAAAALLGQAKAKAFARS